MYQTLVQLHSIGRWIVLLLLVVAIFRSATAGSRPYTKGDKTTGLLLTIFTDLMLLIGIYLWFVSGVGYPSIKESGMGSVMQNPVLRFYNTQHLVGMLIAIALIHVGKAQGKKNLPDRTKHRRTFLFYLLALLLILACIPWPFMQAGAGRGWV
jgi:hypothetical protein